MPYSKGSLWRLLKCRIIRQIVAVINNRHIKTATLYTFFCSVSHKGSMRVVCIAHTGASRENDPWRRGVPLGLGFPREVACMAREYLGHPQK